MHVKSAFLNGNLKKEVYILQPAEFERTELTNHVYKMTMTCIKTSPKILVMNNYQSSSSYIDTPEVKLKTPNF